VVTVRARHSSVRMVPRYGATTTVLVDGVLDRTTRTSLKDGLLALAAEAPEGLLVDIERLELRDPASAGVFALVALRVGDWPAAPFALVTARDDQLALLAGQTVPVYPDSATAEAAVNHPERRRAGRVPARTSARARGFVRGACDRWQVPELAEDAELIATEFVENVLRHTDSVPRLAMELRGGKLTVEVADESPRPAVVREGLDPIEAGLGLRMVAKVAKTWGSSRCRSGGKTVWAVLRRR
jgi:hypothetical protein